MRKIIHANIRIKDDKGHVQFLTLNDIIADSIVLKSDKQASPPLEEKKSPKKEQKKSSK